MKESPTSHGTIPLLSFIKHLPEPCKLCWCSGIRSLGRFIDTTCLIAQPLFIIRYKFQAQYLGPPRLKACTIFRGSLWLQIAISHLVLNPAPSLMPYINCLHNHHCQMFDFYNIQLQFLAKDRIPLWSYTYEKILILTA